MEPSFNHVIIRLDQVEKRIVDHDRLIRGDGNGNPGYASRIASLEAEREEIKEMLNEWNDTKSQLKGARTTVIVLGVLLTGLGGGLGIAILQALQKLAASLPLP